MTPCVLGLDLSLTCTGLCALPLDWGLDWARVEVGSFGKSLRRDATEGERAHRVSSVMEWVMDELSHYQAQLVVIEEYAFSRIQSQAHALGELGGVV